MADYWKSNERKHCDFCKCWIADNKISISLHEGGKRHKENVAKRISEINKKSTKDFKVQVKVEEEMNKMEKNAMAAYLKDIENNADLTSQIINEKLAETNSTLVIKSSAAPKQSETDDHSGKSKKKTKWQQAKSEDGKIYYWNYETNETLWEPPSEGFVSLADLNVSSKKNKPGGFSKDFKKPKKQKDRRDNSTRKEGPASVSRIPGPSGAAPMGPPPRPENPYGAWTAVQTIAPPDLQLPEQTHGIPTVQAISTTPEKMFKEKQLTSLDDSEGCVVEFKKRKLNNPGRRNVRQRLDDD